MCPHVNATPLFTASKLATVQRAIVATTEHSEERTPTLVEAPFFARVGHVDMPILNRTDSAEVVHLPLNLFDRVFELLHVARGGVAFVLDRSLLLDQHSKVVLQHGALYL